MPDQDLLVAAGALLASVFIGGIALYRLVNLQLTRLSAFPRLNPFPVVELARGRIRFANAAAEDAAASLPGGHRA